MLHAVCYMVYSVHCMVYALCWTLYAVCCTLHATSCTVYTCSSQESESSVVHAAALVNTPWLLQAGSSCTVRAQRRTHRSQTSTLPLSYDPACSSYPSPSSPNNITFCLDSSCRKPLPHRVHVCCALLSCSLLSSPALLWPCWTQWPLSSRVSPRGAPKSQSCGLV